MLYSLACGIKHAVIVGGSAVTPHSLPWQVALVDPGDNWPWCGGTLISDRHVLTAAHCMGGNFDVIVGEHKWNNADGIDGTRHKICRQVKHPSYDDWSLTHDFAIVHLKKAVTDPKATPACLPTANFAGNFLVGKSMTVSGWGTLEAGGLQPKVLHSVKVPGITQAECSEAYSGFVRVLKSMLCAGDVAEGGIDACQGDSGGKLLKEFYAKIFAIKYTMKK